MSIRVAVAIAGAVILSPILPAQAAFTIFGDFSPVQGARTVVELHDLPAPDAVTVFNSRGPCQEDVHLTGTIHLVTNVRRVHGVVEITFFITLAGAGVGTLTGAQYVATGAVRQDVATPTLPAKIPIQETFAWIPLGPCELPRPQKEHLKVRFGLEFDATGNFIRLTTLPEFGDTLLSFDLVAQDDPDDRVNNGL